MFLYDNLCQDGWQRSSKDWPPHRVFGGIPPQGGNDEWFRSTPPVYIAYHPHTLSALVGEGGWLFDQYVLKNRKLKYFTKNSEEIGIENG